MGESKIIIEEIEKSSSKSPPAPLCQRGGNILGALIFSPLYEERGVRGDFFWEFNFCL